MKKTKLAGFGRYAGTTVLIGAGFFTMGLMDPLYDTYTPIFFRRYIDSNAAVGALMTLDNVLQLALIPIIAVWSDRTRTRLGRRLPFIAVMLPISAVLFTLFPSAAASSLLALLALVFAFNIFKTSVRGPVVALMPDTIPGEYRSEANGVINMMSGIGLIASTLALAPLIDRNQNLPFLASGVCIIAAVLVLLIFVREKRPEDYEASEQKKSPIASIKEAFSGISAENGERDYSCARILVSLFFWFLAYEGAKPFLGLYLVEVMGTSAGNAALAQGVAGIASVIMAVPSGYIAHRVGRRRCIRVCLVFLALVLFLIPLAGLLNLGPAKGLLVFLALMFFYGIFWMGVVVNSFPMLWQMAVYGNIGVYTGLYYTFSQSAAILAPPVTGLIIDIAGFAGIFIFGGVCMLAAWVIMAGVKSGESGGASEKVHTRP